MKSTTDIMTRNIVLLELIKISKTVWWWIFIQRSLPLTSSKVRMYDKAAEALYKADNLPIIIEKVLRVMAIPFVNALCVPSETVLRSGCVTYF